MKIFVAASYSSKVNYDTGQVFPHYKEWLEAILRALEVKGYTVFCALRADNYQINNNNPAAAFRLDLQEIKQCDVMLALLGVSSSAGIQTEIGVALGLNKKVILAHLPEDDLAYFNAAMVKAGAVQSIKLPLDEELLEKILLS